MTSTIETTDKTVAKKLYWLSMIQKKPLETFSIHYIRFITME